MAGTRGFTFEESFTVATAEARTLELPTIQIPGSLHLTQLSAYNSESNTLRVQLWVEKGGHRYPIAEVRATDNDRIYHTTINVWLSGDIRLIAVFPAQTAADIVRWALYGLEYLA